MSYWEELERPGPDAVVVAGRELRAGSRVRLRPRAGGDVFDLVLADRVAVIEAIEEDLEGGLRLAVVVEDDPGRDLGLARQPGHRFFFAPEEVEPLGEVAVAAGPDRGAAGPDRVAAPRILVAGIGNVFLGDDGFGVALAERVSRLELPAGVKVVDFGIRGLDLAFAIEDGYDAVILLDATPRGQAPGTLYVIELDPDQEVEATLDAHGLDPARVVGLLSVLGVTPPPMFVIGCEPSTLVSPDEEEIVAQLSEPVRSALEEAPRLVRSLLADLLEKSTNEEVHDRCRSR